MDKDLIDKAYHSILSTEQNYIKTGFSILDEYFANYLQGNLFSFIGGYSTLYMEDILINLLNKNFKCVYITPKAYSLEFTKKIFKRVLSDGKSIDETKETVSKLQLCFNDNNFMNKMHITSTFEPNKNFMIFINNIDKVKIENIPIEYFTDYLWNFIQNKKLQAKEYNIVSNKIDEINELQLMSKEAEISFHYIESTLEEIKNELPPKVFTDYFLDLTAQKIVNSYFIEMIRKLTTRFNQVIFTSCGDENQLLINKSEVVLNTKSIIENEKIMINIDIVKNIRGKLGSFTSFQYEPKLLKFIKIGGNYEN